MTDKSLVVPKCSRFTLDFPFSSLRAGGKIRRVRLLHVKDEKDAFVCGEKRIAVNSFSSATITRLFSTSIEAIYYNHNNSTMFFCAYYRTLSGIYDPKYVIEYYEQNGTQKILILNSSRTYLANSSGSTYTTFANVGGNCAAIHCERVFIGQGEILHYTEPMQGSTLNQPSTYGYGNIRFMDELGSIFGIVSLRGKLYLFREHGITAITAFADPLNFKAETVPYNCGTILANSVVKCEDKVCFFTENGLHVFDGTSCKRAANTDDEEIDLTSSMPNAVCFQGRYFAGVKLKNGQHVIYSYNLKSEFGRYLIYDCSSVAANNIRFYFSCNDVTNQVFGFSGKSFGKNGECELEVKFTAGDTGKGDTYAEYVAVKGAGKISLSLENEFGEKVTAAGLCGKTVRLPRALRGGEFTLKITPADPEFRIEAVSFGMRRDAYDD